MELETQEAVKALRRTVHAELIAHQAVPIATSAPQSFPSFELRVDSKVHLYQTIRFNYYLRLLKLGPTSIIIDESRDTVHIPGLCNGNEHPGFNDECI